MVLGNKKTQDASWRSGFFTYVSFCCGRSYTPLELYDTVAGNLEIMRKWNDDMAAFLALGRKEAAMQVLL